MLAVVAELSPLEHADTARSEAMQASFKKRTGRPLIDVAAEVSEGHHIRCRTEASPRCQQGQSRQCDARRRPVVERGGPVPALIAPSGKTPTRCAASSDMAVVAAPS